MTRAHVASTDDIASPADLARRIQAGQTHAERELVERYARGVLFFLHGLTRDAARAQDLQQEAFRLAIEKIRAGELRKPDRLVVFVRQIAKNLFIAEYRKRKKQPAETGEEVLGYSPDHAPSPLQQLIAKENMAIVLQLLASLEPTRDRELLTRLFVAEESKEEICAALDLSTLHFNRVLHRARHRLKKLVTEYQTQKGKSA